MKSNSSNEIVKNASSFTSAVLKGIGQIMLQENQITGFLFLTGIFYGSFIMGFAALLATIIGTVTAFLLKYDQSEINKGLYGFSAALVGVAVMLFLKPVFLSWLLVVIGSSLATIIQHFFISRKIPVFTLPFVLVTWFLIYFTRIFHTDILSISSPLQSSTIEILTIAFRGFGQVIFQDNLIAGLLFFIAVLISSPISALYGFAAALVSAFIAFQLPLSVDAICMGLFSYNAVLCAIVFAGAQIKEGWWVFLSVLLSVFINVVMVKYNFIPLTFPFVLASFVTLLLKSKYCFIFKKAKNH